MPYLRESREIQFLSQNMIESTRKVIIQHCNRKGLGIVILPTNQYPEKSHGLQPENCTFSTKETHQINLHHRYSVVIYCSLRCRGVFYMAQAAHGDSLIRSPGS